MPAVRIAPTTSRFLARELVRSRQPGPLVHLAKRFTDASDARERSIELNDIEAAYTARVIERDLLPRTTEITRVVFESLLARMDGHTPSRKTKEKRHDTV